MKQIKIVFLGSDGAGKSTLIEFFKKEIHKEGKTAESFVMGWKDFKNPILRFFSNIYLRRKKTKPDEERIDRFRARSFFFYFIYYSELWLRYLSVIFSKSSSYLLFDRYFYDELTFAGNFNFKLFLIITPKPDLIVLVKTSFNELINRGEKVSKEKLNYFYSHLQKAKKFAPLIEIDGSMPAALNYKKIMNFLNKTS